MLLELKTINFTISLFFFFLFKLDFFFLKLFFFCFVYFKTFILRKFQKLFIKKCQRFQPSMSMSIAQLNFVSLINSPFHKRSIRPAFAYNTKRLLFVVFSVQARARRHHFRRETPPKKSHHPFQPFASDWLR